MDERTFEDIICKYPELVENDLSFKGRQVMVRGKRVDILFEDRHGQKLIVEIKRGTVLRSHVGQLLDYEGNFVSDDNPNVRVMLVGNRVPENLRRSLNHHGFEWKELTITALVNFLSTKDDPDIMNRLTSEKPLMLDIHRKTERRQSGTSLQTSPRVANRSTPPINTAPNINLSTEAPNISLFKRAGYSVSEIDDLHRAVLIFYQIVLPRKTLREAEAGEVLRRFRGKYTEKILDNVFDTVDKDPSGAWFGPTLSRPNRNQLYRNPMAELNRLIDMLLESGDLGWLGQWRRAGNRGMKTGIATLLMYLYSPDFYNVWLPKTHRGLLRLSRFDAESPEKELSAEKCTICYQHFNETAIAVRKEYGIVPQAMDWFLWAATEIKEDPGNRSLRAYIDGITK